jgi:hypothetical protein
MGRRRFERLARSEQRLSVESGACCRSHTRTHARCFEFWQQQQWYTRVRGTGSGSIIIIIIVVVVVASSGIKYC